VASGVVEELAGLTRVSRHCLPNHMHPFNSATLTQRTVSTLTMLPSQ
jgi:hypothetical protein